MSTDAMASATTGRDNGPWYNSHAGASSILGGARMEQQDVEVHLTARDLKGNLLFDHMGGHIFRIENGLIRRFDIR